jgi:TPR repeat protein
MRGRAAIVALLALAAAAGAANAQLRPDPPLDCRAFSDAAARRDCARANAGNAQAQASTGLLYVAGRGVPVDYAAALRLFRLAVGQGDVAANVYLGAMYAAGRGVAPDYREAVRLFRAAADKGNPVAQVDLGDMYATGRGVAKNDDEATRLYRLAARQGNADGMNGVAWRLAVGGGNLDEALTWAARAAALEPDNPGFQDTLGWIFYRQKKPELALFHAQRAVALEPRCAPCEDHLGDIAAALGRRVEARGHWQRALELSAGMPSADPDWDRAEVVRKLSAP